MEQLALARGAMTVFVAAQEHAAANALIPVISQLSARRDVRVEAIACAEAAAVFARAGVPHRLAAHPGEDEPAAVAMVRRDLTDASPDALLLGTAWGPALDKVVLRIGSHRGIPSVSVVDHWSNFRERFADPASDTLSLPTKIAVMDEWAMTEAVKAGLPEEVVTVTGHPYLDQLAVELQQPVLLQRARGLRQEWLQGVEGGRPCIVLFVSEALSRYHDLHGPHPLGYTEVDVLEGLISTVQRLPAAPSRQWHLVIKLHPREPDHPASSLSPLARRWSLRVVKDQPAWVCLLAADVVVGMGSMLLVEAALAGKPAISFRPNATAPCPFIGSEIGLVPTAASLEELARLLSRSTADPSAHVPGRRGEVGPVARLVRGDSALRIADLVVELAASAPRSLHALLSS